MAEINVIDLTTGQTQGTGIFDQLMGVTKAHIQEEYEKGRIKGTEYSTVYLGALQAVMDRSLQFLLQQQRTDLEAQLMAEQIATERLQQENLTQQTANLVATQAQIEAQTALAVQQEANLVAEGLNIPKQGLLIDAQTAQAQQQTINLTSEDLSIKAQTSLTDQQVANALTENDVMLKQICKLEAEFDVLVEQKLKTVQETSLLGQKKTTEEAQTQATNVNPDSVIGRQKDLYKKQTEGYQRNAEQKAAKLLIDTWNVRRTTDVGTVAGKDPDDAGAIDNHLGNQDIADVVLALKAGLNNG